MPGSHPGDPGSSPGGGILSHVFALANGSGRSRQNLLSSLLGNRLGTLSGGVSVCESSSQSSRKYLPQRSGERRTSGPKAKSGVPSAKQNSETAWEHFRVAAAFARLRRDLRERISRRGSANAAHRRQKQRAQHPAPNKTMFTP